MKRNDDWRNAVEQLFHRVASVAPHQRDAMLRRAEADPSVKEEVRSLIDGSPTDGPLAKRLSSLSEGFAALLNDEDGQDSVDVPQWIGKYEVLGVLGTGGMGRVYEARNPDSEAVVAIKVLVKGNEARFEREARALGRLEHENVARIFDYDHDDSGRPFLVMERIEGVRLDEHCRGRSLRERLELLIRLCHGVHHAHQRQVLHRDLKPSNVLVTSSGQLKVLDFGIARLLEGDDLVVSRGEGENKFDRLTKDGGVSGTPPYMSPEQRRGEEVDVRSDIYSIGSLAYEILGGHRLLPSLRSTDSASDPDEHRLMRMEPSPLRNRNRECGRDLQFLVHRCLALEPDDRPASAIALAKDLQQVIDRRPVEDYGGLAYRAECTVRRRWPWFVAASVVLLVAAYGWIERESNLQRMIDSGRQSRAAVDFIRYIVRGGTNYFRPNDPIGAVVDRAAEGIDEAYPNDPAIQAELCQLIVSLYTGLGEFEKAAVFASKGENLWAQVDPGGESWIHATFMLGKSLDGALMIWKAKAVLDDLAVRFPIDQRSSVLPDLLRAEVLRARVYAKIHDRKQSYRILKKVLPKLQAARTLDTATIATARLLESDGLCSGGDLRRAKEKVNVAFELIKSRDPEDYDAAILGSVRSARALLLSKEGYAQEGLDEMLDVAREFADRHGEESAQYLHALCLLAVCHGYAGKTDSALTIAKQATDKLAQTLGREHIIYITQRLLFTSLLMDSNEAERARVELEAILEVVLKAPKDQQSLASIVRVHLAHAATLSGNGAQARAMFTEIAKDYKTTHTSPLPIASCICSIAQVALLEGKAEEATRRLSEAREILADYGPLVGTQTAEIDVYVGACLWLQRDLSTAEKILGDALAVFRPLSERAGCVEADGTFFLAGVLADQEKYAEAEKLLVELTERLPNTGLGRIQRLRCDAARLLPIHHLGRPAEAISLAKSLRDQVGLEEDHLSTEKLIILENLSALFAARQEPGRVAELIPPLLYQQRAFRGEDHPSVERTELLQIIALTAAGQPASEDWLRNYLARDRERTSEDLQSVSITLLKILRDEGRYEEAVAFTDTHALPLYPDPDTSGWRGLLLTRRAEYLTYVGRIEEGRAQLAEVDRRVREGENRPADVAQARPFAVLALRNAGVEIPNDS